MPSPPPIFINPTSGIANRWSYETPLEQPDEANTPFILDSRVIEINGMRFQARSDCDYANNYYGLAKRVEQWRKFSDSQKKSNLHLSDINFYRNFIQQDLWFIVYFVAKNPLANHPFIVEACKEIQAEKGDSLEVWARDHLKTTIISVCSPIQKVMNNSEERIAIMSAVRPLALKIQNLIKKILESKFMINSFPDILYDDPKKEADKWTEAPEGGLIVKRKGFYKESTFASFGLVEGMPTGDHYTKVICDDIVTQDYQSPESIQKVCDNFDMMENITTRDRQITVVGTYYRHDDPLVYIGNKKDPVTGESMFKVRKKAATVDGAFNGRSVFLPEATLAKKRAGKKFFFYCQQLLNPTPREAETLNRDRVKIVSRKELPINLYKFMMVDGSGDQGRRNDRAADPWSIMVIGVEPIRDNLGTSRVYILDMVIKQMKMVDALNEVVKVYSRNGKILKLGVEKVGQSSTEIHVAAALRAKGKHITIENKRLVILNPAKRSKSFRIETALAWPLDHGKIHMLETIPQEYRDRLLQEMEKFPAWHDDGLDTLSYGYDIIKGYRFGTSEEEEVEKKDSYTKAFERAKEKQLNRQGWQVA